MVSKQIMANAKDFRLDKVEINLYESGVNKPLKALWTSNLKYPLEDTGWVSWCLENDFDMKPYLWILIPKEDTRVYTIDTLEDWENCPKTEGVGHWRFIDWKRLADGYDGLHITWNGAYLGHGWPEFVMELNGFDCESTVWFNTRWIQEVIPLGETKKAIRH